MIFDTRHDGFGFGFVQHIADPCRAKMAEWLGEEVKQSNKRYIVVHTKSDNTIYEGVKLVGLVRNGDLVIQRISVKQLRNPNILNFEFNDILSLQVH